MPNIAVSIANIENSVERPIIFDVVRQMMQVTKISPGTPIRFYGDEGKAAQKNSTLTKDPSTENLWDYDEKVTIEVDEDFERDRILATAIKSPENRHVFVDNALGVYMKPIYSSTDVTIHVKYRARDRNQVNRWRNNIRAYTALMRDINLHEFSYHYQIPSVFLVLLQELHRLREQVAPYGETFEEYLTQHLSTTASIVTNLSGKESIWAISEKQIRVQGYFDFEGVPDKPDKEGDHDTWTASFSYKFKYDKPIQCDLVYPVVIHNQVLSSHYRPTEPVYSLQDKLRSFTLTGQALSAFEEDATSVLYRGSKGISIPNFDEFSPNSIPLGTVRVLMVLSTITAADKQTLFNLNELGDVCLDADVLQFIRESEYPYISTTYASILCLNLYQDADLQGSGSVSVDATLAILAAAPLSLRNTHRLRLSMVVDLSLLSPDALARLKKYPAAAAKIAKAIDAALRDLGNQADIKKNKLTPDDYRKMGLDPTGTYQPFHPKHIDGISMQPVFGYPNNDAIWGLAQILFVLAKPAASR